MDDGVKEVIIIFLFREIKIFKTLKTSRSGRNNPIALYKMSVKGTHATLPLLRYGISVISA